MLCMTVAKWAMVLFEAGAGRCFDLLLASLTVIAALQLWERMAVDVLHSYYVEEGAASSSRGDGGGRLTAPSLEQN